MSTVISDSSKIDVDITISIKGSNKSVDIIRKYTMQEHYDELFLADGKSYAVNELGLNESEVIVQCGPVIDKKIEAAINAELGSGDKASIGNMAIPKIHNPMHSCFEGYQSMDFHGIPLLVKSVSAGIVYAIKNEQWMEEFKQGN
jgi:hypothetical protein